MTGALGALLLYQVTLKFPNTSYIWFRILWPFYLNKIPAKYRYRYYQRNWWIQNMLVRTFNADTIGPTYLPTELPLCYWNVPLFEVTIITVIFANRALVRCAGEKWLLQRIIVEMLSWWDEAENTQTTHNYVCVGTHRRRFMNRWRGLPAGEQYRLV